MYAIDRSVLVVKPKQPFLDWARTLNDDCATLTLDEVRSDTTIYLVPRYWDEADQHDILDQCFEVAFVEQLFGWSTKPETWPQKRDLQTFKEWFDWEFHGIALDLLDEPIGNADEIDDEEDMDDLDEDSDEDDDDEDRPSTS